VSLGHIPRRPSSYARGVMASGLPNAMCEERMRSLVAIAAWLIYVSPACCQRLYFGVLGGTNVTANFPRTDYTTPADSFGNPASHFQFRTGDRSPTLGLSADARLSGSFSIEADVLRRPMDSKIIYTAFPAGSPAVTTTLRFTEVEAWEFPLLLKYRLPSLRFAHPFFGDRAGISLPAERGRHRTNTNRGFGRRGHVIRPGPHSHRAAATLHALG